jgi:hypothetical protein
MSTSTSSTTEMIRRGLLKIDDATVLATVDSLNLRGNNKIQAVVGMPLRTLQQRRDVTTFASSAPIAAVKGILELLALAPLEQVVEALGDHADSPSYDQLNAAVDQLLANGATNDDIVALLTFAIGEEFPAAAHCRRLLEERAEFQLPQLPEVAAPASLLVPKEVDAEVREQRRARREEEKRKKQGAALTRPARPVKVKRVEKPKPARAVSPPVGEILSVQATRRRVALTPGELAVFSPDHPVVGSVVLVEVPFDAVDPDQPDQKSKARPAVVVGASNEGVLVQGVYSNQTPSRVLFQPWRRLGLDHVSYIDPVRIALDVAPSSMERLGRLTDDEWNTLS